MNHPEPTGPLFFILGIVSGAGIALVVLLSPGVVVDFLITHKLLEILESYTKTGVDLILPVISMMAWVTIFGILGVIAYFLERDSQRKHKSLAKSVPEQRESKEAINTGSMIGFGTGGGYVTGLAIIMVLELSMGITTAVFDQVSVFVVALIISFLGVVAEVYASRLSRPPD